MNIEEAKRRIKILLTDDCNCSECLKDKEAYKTVLAELEKKDKIINSAINEIENLRQYFSEDLQSDFVRILEILKDKDVKDWDDPNSKVKEAMAVAALSALPLIKPIEDIQEEITKAINKQIAIGIDIGKGDSKSKQSIKNTMMFAD